MKLLAAADDAGAPVLAIGGGVAANSRLRARVAEAAAATGRGAFLPPAHLCTDNGAMIAATAWWRLEADGPTSLGAGADPNLRLVCTRGPTQLVGSGAALVPRLSTRQRRVLTIAGSIQPTICTLQEEHVRVCNRSETGSSSVPVTPRRRP